MKTDKLFVLWLMGPTSSGKTTIARGFHERWISKNIPIFHLDGDEIRDIFGSSLVFKEEDRLRVVKTIFYFANKSIASGVNVVVSALTANNDAREYVLNNVSNLIVGYINCSIDTCIRRDPKGLYRKAIKGKIDTLAGYNCDYLPPAKYDFTINTEDNDVYQSVKIIEQYLNEKWLVGI